MKIKELLSIDLNEEIKNVIDIESLQEDEIQKEIEDYIVTKGLAEDFEKLIDRYTSQAKETGIWISGFFGSGKSYFSKMVGYLLSNQMINGTPARERILQRFTGIPNEAFFKNKVGQLDQNENLVVFLDISKQNTDKGFSFTLFKNYLKALNLPENEYGYMLYNQMLADNVTDVSKYVEEVLDENWDGLRRSLPKYFKACKDIHLKKGLSEKEFDQILDSTKGSMASFDANTLVDLIQSFLDLKPGWKVVFMFDETSEAIKQEKLKPLDLEGVSEAFNRLGSRLWTIAIAQQKLDDVISSTGLSKADLTKITDRFHEKIHLESKEVDTIIKTRVLGKKDSAIPQLTQYYQENSGKIGDHSDLKGYGIPNTGNVDSYVEYYPFYEGQLDLLQNFLFGSTGLTSTKVAERGMIITTFDILKRQVQNREAFDAVTGWQIAKEADKQPDARLVKRLDAGEKILADHFIEGRHLLETINFLNEAEVIKTTLVNIAKSYFANPDDVFTHKEDLKEALDELEKAKILIQKDKIYTITSDVEQKLLDEMNGFVVQGFQRKNKLTEFYKKSKLLESLSSVKEGSLYKFRVETDDQDVLYNPSDTTLNFRIKSLYTTGDDRTQEINELKAKYENHKDLAILYPENNKFPKIDRLIEEIIRIEQIANKYPSKSSDEGKVVQDLLRAKEEKEEYLQQELKKAFENGTTIYLFNITMLNEENFASEVGLLKKDMVKKVYHKRLSHQLLEDVVKAVFQSPDTRLHTYFNEDDFRFFDRNGNFIGDKLSVVEEISYLMRNTFVSGEDIEDHLSKAPTGYSYGTIIGSLAALLRAGKLSVKTPTTGKLILTVKDEGARDVFSKVSNFKKASFKVNTQSLSHHQKSEIVEFILDNELNKVLKEIGEDAVDYNTNDYQLISSVHKIAQTYVNKIKGFDKEIDGFQEYFPNSRTIQEELNDFTASVTAENYIHRASDFINNLDSYEENIQEVNGMEDFIQTKLKKIKSWKLFVDNVKADLDKVSATNKDIDSSVEEYGRLLQSNLTNNYTQLQNTFQAVKDAYYTIYKELVSANAEKFKALHNRADQVIQKIQELPKGLNEDAFKKAENTKHFAYQYMTNEVIINDTVNNETTKGSYSDYSKSVQLITSKMTDLEVAKSSLVTKKPDPKDPPQSKTYTSKIPSKTMSVVDYKNWLTQEMHKLASAQNDDKIEIDF